MRPARGSQASHWGHTAQSYGSSRGSAIQPRRRQQQQGGGAQKRKSSKKCAHLQRVDELLARGDRDAGEAVEEVHLRADLGRVALDGDGPVARGAAAAKCEHRDAPPAELRGRDGREQRREPAVERRGVHVPAALRALHRRRDVLPVVPLGERDERLLQRLVRQRLGGRQRQQRGRVVCGDRGKLRRGGVCDEVVVHLEVRLL